MLVTIMTDGSFCHRTKAAGWGVWCKSQRGQFHSGGSFKSDCKTSAEVEAKAAAIGIFTAFETGVAIAGDTIILQVDYIPVRDALLGREPRMIGLPKRSEKAIKYCHSLIDKNRCALDVRHVKAHAPRMGKRNYVNDLCDKAAKTAMRKMRDVILADRQARKEKRT